MRNIVLDLAVTIDGFIEGPNGEVDWCVLDDDMGFEKFLTGIDAIFYGRVSYDMWGNFQPDADASAVEKALWEQVHAKKKYVFTNNPPQDDRAIFISADLEQQVNRIREEPGKDIWLYGGAKLISTFLTYRLIDIYRLSVHPVVLGAGKPLFENLQRRRNLSLLEVNKFRSGVVQLVYSHQRQGAVE